MGTYKDYLEKLAPPWLQAPRGRRWTRSVGDGLDALVDRLKSGVKARFPLEAPEDALGRIGLERGIPRGVVESTEAYAARLADAWETWPWAGTPYGMLRAFRAAGYDNVALEIVGGKQFTLDENGALVIDGLPAGSWAIDATPEFWSKFQVLFRTPLPSGWMLIPTVGPVAVVAVTGIPSAPTVSPGVSTLQPFRLDIEILTTGASGVATFRYSTDGGLTWSAAIVTSGANGIPAPYGVRIRFVGNYTAGDKWFCEITFASTPDASSPTADSIRALVSQWKPAHATCSGIVLQGAGRIWGYPHAGASWNNRGATWGGNSSVVWPYA